IILSGVKDGIGIVCLADGRIVIADYKNSKCCLCDSSFNHMSDFTISSEPWGMCIIDTDEVAVVLLIEKKVQFLKIGDTIQPSGLITTRRKCRSLVALNKDIVYAGSMIDMQTYYWGTITRGGVEKSCFHIPRGNTKFSDVNITLNSCKTRSYISCYDAGTVYCFGVDGMQYFEYKVQEGPDQGNPLVIALDRENNLRVFVKNMNSIHRLSPEGVILQIIKDIIPESPHATCFKRSGDSFLLTSIGSTTSNICFSYKLK
ncbi:hypothetical protein CHS0354_022691, partial [Potamilus streckersoni]